MAQNRAMKRFVAALLVVLFAPAALAGGSGKCLECHDIGEFEGMDAAELADAIQDTGIRPHKKLDLTDEQISTIAAELADD